MWNLKHKINKTETNIDTESRHIVARWEGVGQLGKNKKGLGYAKGPWLVWLSGLSTGL